MSDTKISEAAHKLAYETGMYYSQNEKCQPGIPFYAFTQGELDRFVEKLAHLQGEAVPVAWQSMATCPRDGSVVLLRWGEDHVSPGWWSAPVSPVQNDDGTWPSDSGGFPWAFFDTDNGRHFVNHAVDTKYGPTHWTPYTRPQPAELAEQQEVELPPLPPVDGYDKRVHGHYSAEQMRDYARNAIRSAKQEQACSGLGIDKMAKELLERHTVAVPVAVEDGRCFMVREQDALDAIRAALAATGKQQVAEVKGDGLLESLVARWRKDADEAGTSDNMLCQKIANCTMRHAAELQAVIAARQPGASNQVVEKIEQLAVDTQPGAQVPDAYLVQAVKDGEAWEHRWYIPRWGDADPSALDGTVYEVRGKKHPELGTYRVKPFYSAPPAQGIDLGQFREPVNYWRAHHKKWATDRFATMGRKIESERIVRRADNMLAMIDNPHDAAPGVSNGY